jgi:hypothetical protein
MTLFDLSTLTRRSVVRQLVAAVLGTALRPSLARAAEQNQPEDASQQLGDPATGSPGKAAPTATSIVTSDPAASAAGDLTQAPFLQIATAAGLAIGAQVSASGRSRTVHSGVPTHSTAGAVVTMVMNGAAGGLMLGGEVA